jgi:hypothetical protein
VTVVMTVEMGVVMGVVVTDHPIAR